MTKMLAKMAIEAVSSDANSDFLTLAATGSVEDNTYCTFAPLATMKICVTNRDMLGQIRPGDVFRLEFTRIEKTEV